MLLQWSEWIWSMVLPLLLVSGVCGSPCAPGALPCQPGPGHRIVFSNPAGVPGQASPFSCLCTALASTVGTGNIAGVAFALTAGGPGAWSGWISAAVGTAVKYAECALAVQYRRTKPGGGVLGDPWLP